MKWVIRIVLGIIFVFVLLVVGVYFYAKKNQAYSDKKYGFTLLNQTGWYSAPERQGVYYLVGTKDENSNNIVSTFSVSPIETLYSLDSQRKYALVGKSCNEMFTQPDFSPVEVEETSVNRIAGIVCLTENTPSHVNMLYTTKAYTLFNNRGGKYDYIVTVSYPKDNKLEKEKVNRILNSFRIDLL